ncbi:hypothetical protein [Secundilactobacillus muriivasis]
MDAYNELIKQTNPKLVEAAKVYLQSVKAYFNGKQGTPDELLSIAAAARLLHVDRGFVEALLLDPACPRITAGTGHQVRLPKKLLLEYVTDRSKQWYRY